MPGREQGQPVLQEGPDVPRELGPEKFSGTCGALGAANHQSAKAVFLIDPPAAGSFSTVNDFPFLANRLEGNPARFLALLLEGSPWNV